MDALNFDSTAAAPPRGDETSAMPRRGTVARVPAIPTS